MTLGFGFGFPRRWPGATVWTPAVIQTALWLDANDTSTITLNGSTVSQWNDKSGNGRHVSQGTAADQPAYQSNALNSKPGVVAGASDFLDSATNWTAGINTSWFLVGKRTGGVNTSIIGVSTASNTLIPLCQPSNPGAFNTLRVAGVNEPAGSKHFYNGDSTMAAMDRPTLYNFIGNNFIGEWINLPSFNGPPRIINRQDSLFFEYQGVISEIVVTSGEPNTDTRQKIEGYLAWKWALESNLPANHPYKNNPPTV